MIHKKFRIENKSTGIIVCSSMNRTQSTVGDFEISQQNSNGRRYMSSCQTRIEMVMTEDIGIQKREESKKCLLAETQRGYQRMLHRVLQSQAENLGGGGVLDLSLGRGVPLEP